MSALAGALPILAASRALMGMLRQRAEKSDTPTQFSEQLQQAVQQMDANADGYLDATEFQGSAELFRAWDTDRDGLLTQAEIVDGLQHAARERSVAQNVDNAFRLQDADRDGVLQSEEMGLRGREFNRFDTNRDGEVSRTELERAYGGEV
jgi:Ca2+-binding EF-hand superfamily protein